MNPYVIYFACLLLGVLCGVGLTGLIVGGHSDPSDSDRLDFAENNRVSLFPAAETTHWGILGDGILLASGSDIREALDKAIEKAAAANIAANRRDS